MQVADVEVGGLCWLLHELDQRLAALTLAPCFRQQLRRLLARVARRAVLLHVDNVLTSVELTDGRENSLHNHLHILLARSTQLGGLRSSGTARQGAHTIWSNASPMEGNGRTRVAGRTKSRCFVSLSRCGARHRVGPSQVATSQTCAPARAAAAGVPPRKVTLTNSPKSLPGGSCHSSEYLYLYGFSLLFMTATL